jgi:hypothetical protein
MTASVDLSKPYILENNTISGIVHEIDSMNQYLKKGGAEYLDGI